MQEEIISGVSRRARFYVPSDCAAVHLLQVVSFPAYENATLGKCYLFQGMHLLGSSKFKNAVPLPFHEISSSQFVIFDFKNIPFSMDVFSVRVAFIAIHSETSSTT